MLSNETENAKFLREQASPGDTLSIILCENSACSIDSDVSKMTVPKSRCKFNFGEGRKS